MAIVTQYVNTKVVDGSAATIVSDSFDSTGFTHIFAEAKWEGAATTFTLSDNKSSSNFVYGGMLDHTNNDMHTQCGWFPITGASGHTVTVTFGAARVYKRLHIWLINATTGAIALYKEITNQGTAGSVINETFHTDVATVSFFTVGEYTAATYTLLPDAWNLNFKANDFAASRTDPTDASIYSSLTFTSMAYVSRVTSLRETKTSATYVRKSRHSHAAIANRKRLGR